MVKCIIIGCNKDAKYIKKENKNPICSKHYYQLDLSQYKFYNKIEGKPND